MMRTVERSPVTLVDAMGIARLLGKQQPDKYENSIGTHRRGE
ncbi:MAG: hypothetical protein QOH31_1531 [Verrucomicrobiota bacterium]|jgi:hypothetical protein